MLHKLLMLELDSANNKQQENKGVANESAETKDRNRELNAYANIEPKIYANEAVSASPS